MYNLEPFFSDRVKIYTNEILKEKILLVDGQVVYKITWILDEHKPTDIEVYLEWLSQK